MPAQMERVIRHIREVAVRHDDAGLTDGQLLGRFLESRDEAAVSALVRRHGAMVWGVCRRILRDYHDAEDAFQATFLVLVRKAGSIRQKEVVGNWLYGVAQQTAMKARSNAARRRQRETQVTPMPEGQTSEPEDWSDVQAVLDEELSRLPDRYRTVIVLCDLGGKTRKEAARQLRLPEGTVSGHLTRGRAILAKRLARRGLAISAAAVAVTLSGELAVAHAPASVMSETVKAIVLSSAPEAAFTGISIKVAVLTEGVLKAMLLAKLKTVAGVCVVLGLLMLGGMFAFRTDAADPTAPVASTDRLADTLILLDKQWWEAASKNDVDTLARILADDWIGGPWNKKMSLDHYRQSRYVEVKFLTERRVVRIDEHTAMMSYEVAWSAETKAERQPRNSSGHDRIIHCWVQRDGGWFVKYTECVNLPAVKQEAPPAVAPDPKALQPLPPVVPPHGPDPELVPPAPPGIVPLGPTVPPWTPPPGVVPVDPLAPPSTGPAPTPWNHGVRASSTWEPNTPEEAFDDSRETMWNSGNYAPAWIEKDLGATMKLTSIALHVSQEPEGPTIHEVWVSNEPIGNDRSKAKLVHTFKGNTRNLDMLKCDFPKDTQARYVLIYTTESPSWVGWWEVEITVKAK
jgi:RNA polymerase sigma factor (sigma-70 family)